MGIVIRSGQFDGKYRIIMLKYYVFDYEIETKVIVENGCFVSEYRMILIIFTKRMDKKLGKTMKNVKND